MVVRKLLLVNSTLLSILVIEAKIIGITANILENNTMKETDLQNIDAVQYHSNKTNVVVPDLGIYCQSFQSCFECVNNLMHPCYWCHNYGCTDKPDSLCPETMAKINKTNMHMNLLCPYIKHDGAILVPAGTRVNLKVTLHAPDPVIYDKEIICQIHFKQSLTHLRGLIVNDVIYCYPVVLQSKGHGETNTGLLKIIWGGIEPISNGIPVSVYNCENLADNCKDCILIPIKYGCGWCDKIKKCIIADKCGSSLLKWSLNRLECNYDRRFIVI